MMALKLHRGLVWAVILATVAVLLAACGASESSSGASSSLFPEVATVSVSPVITGNISATANYAAVVEARRMVDVAPLTTGRVESLTVDIGSDVREGQVIAELSQGTLEVQLEQAHGTLRGAQAKLALARASAEPKQVQAQAQLNAATAKLEQLRNPTVADLRAAESSVAATQSVLDGTETKLDQLLNPQAADLQDAESKVEIARDKLDNARIGLDQLQDPLASDLQAKESAVTTAQSKLDSAETKLDQLLDPSSADLAAANEDVADAQSKLSAAQVVVNDAISKEISRRTLSTGLRQTWELLRDARINEQANEAALSNPSLTTTLTASEKLEAEQAIATYQQDASAKLAQIIPSSLIPEDIRTALWAESGAQAALDSANEKLMELLDPNQSAISLAQDGVAIAQASLDSAQAGLEELIQPTQSIIALAQNSVSIAKASLDSAQANLGELTVPDRETVDLARSEVDGGQAALAAAKAKLDLLQNPQPADLAAAEAAVATAEQSLAVSTTNFDKETAQASVDIAQAQVDLKQQQLVDLQVLAPFDGFVAQRWVATGAMVSPQAPIVSIASSDVVVSLRVDETEIGDLFQGQQVTFTTRALPGQTVASTIERISPSGGEGSYSFLVQPLAVEDALNLKAGMSGQVSISTSHENVVLVPSQAVLRKAGGSAVFVVRDGKAHLRSVDIGLFDENNTEVRGDIQSGDQVVVSGHNLLSDGDPVNVQ